MNDVMNERIRELYEQARLHAKSIDADIDPKGWMDLYHQKFAELIVRECAKVCLEQRNPANLNYKPSEQFAEAVKQHFGVY